MPLLAVARLSKRLSVYFYNYGKRCASRTYLLLALSLSFITFFSYPLVQKTFHSDHVAIPLADLDAQIWQSSLHVEFHNFTLFRRPPSTLLITQQIRISQPDSQVTYELVKKAISIYETMTTTLVDLDDGAVSLSTICYKYYGRCMVYRPHYKDKHEFLNSAHDKPNERHPFASFANVSLDRQGRFLRADAVLLTFVLKQHAHLNILPIWNALWDRTQSKLDMMDTTSWPDNKKSPVSAQTQIIPHMIQYKFRLIPFDLSYQGQLAVVAYIAVFFLVSTAFGKSNLVRSGPIFGFAAIFLSAACFTTTWGIFQRLGVELNSAPWFLLLFTVNVASLENVFLLTHAILYAGCDMIVVEKISRGLQSVGVPMTTTLVAELLILNIGKAIDSDVIKEFCLFSEVALVVDYFLGMTFVISILSIDIKRVELTDLDDRKMSKRMHDITNRESDTSQEPESSPAQDTLDKIDTDATADGKDFKTHRAFNSLMLCLIVLGLSLFCSRSKENIADALASNYIDMDQPDIAPIENTHSVVLDTLASRFWTIVNPDKDTLCMQIQPPHLVVYPSQDGMTTIEPSADESTAAESILPKNTIAIEPLETENSMQSHLEKIQAYYNAKSKITNSKYDNEKQPPSLFQLFLFNMLQNALVFILGINVPSLLLCVVMIAIIIWVTPTWREQWLMPFIKTSFEQSIHALIRILPLKIVKMFFFKDAVQNHPVVTKSLEYEADGIQHRGAIAVQNMFNQQQYRTNVKQVRIKTLSHQHTADIYQIDANTKNSIVSYGHDGKIVLWDSQQAKWVARLDEMTPVRGTLQARLNPDYFDHAVTPMKQPNISPKISITMNTKTGSNTSVNKTPLFKQHTSKPSCIKVDPSNRWIATGYDDGLIRIWNINTGMLVRELNVATLPVQVQHEANQQETSNDGTYLQNRFTSSSSNEGSTKRNAGTRFLSSSLNSNRTSHMQFIGTVTEYCHPIVAEAAARCKPNDGSTSYLVSVHKGGIIREWDIVSSECIQTIHTGHTRDITQLHVTDSRAPHRKAGITWVFTSSKDGLVKCFERCRLNKNTKIDPLNDARHQNQQQYQEHEAYYQQQYDHFQQEQQPCQNETRPESTQWDLVYTLDLTAHGTVTCIETELPVGGMGVLVTGSRDGTVKVWNFETGEALTTLSVGRYQRPTSASSEYSSARSLKSFSRFPGSISLLSDSSPFSKKSFGDDFASGLLSDTDSATTHVHSLFNATFADHHSSIHQVVVTRYCEVENGPGVCSACDTCFGNGFLVASSSTDNKVHAWRLERSDDKHAASCTLCTKEYHRKQYRHRKINPTEGGNAPGNGSTRRKRSLSNQSNSSSSTSLKKIIRHTRTLPKNKQTIAEDAGGVELLDIEQLAGDSMIPLSSSFLGVVDQPGGYGLVFCDKILAGVRRTTLEYDGMKRNGEWEVWFASLQYYDPTANDNSLFIPIESFHLDTKSVQQDNTMNDTTQSAQLKEALQDLFNTSHASPYSKSGLLNKKRIHLPKECIDEDEDGTDMLEAGEVLPFSTVRRVIPLDGSGIACDFGNFIKLVFLDRPSLTQKEQMRIRDALKKEDAPFHKDTKSNGCCGNGDGHGSCCSNGDMLSGSQSHQNTWW